MRLSKPVYIVSPDVYDALELVALIYGGVGKGRWFANTAITDSWWANTYDKNCPVCINGMGAFLRLSRDTNPSVIRRIGISTFANDTAVTRLQARGIGHSDSQGYYRVPFKAYAKEVGLVRGQR